MSVNIMQNGQRVKVASGSNMLETTSSNYEAIKNSIPDGSIVAIKNGTDTDKTDVEKDVEAMRTYSYDEVVIGSFLDKPLYRKMIRLDSALTVAYNTFVDTKIVIHQNINVLVNFDILTANNESSTIWRYYTPNIDKSTMHLRLLSTRNASSTINAGTYFLCEYTKTTD